MRGYGHVGSFLHSVVASATVLFAVAVLAVLAVLAACTTGQGPAGSGSWQGSVTPSPTLTAAATGAAFLAEGACAQSDPLGSYREVACADPSAIARVLARFYGPLPDSPSPAATARAGNRCPETTDLVLSIPSGRSQGYACMRELGSPHPGDPGAGGGPRTIVGDCVYATGKGEVKETSCDNSTRNKAQYLVVSITRDRALCPPGTALFVNVGPAGVGCARRL
ncbi:hypothetical protein QMK19_06425 [Streptomyces sp. H10-C2]|uniref:hypothetical protein n=1 Tax=unclassified Streptomyces TaxID=2593676 RepID=UPI0024BB3336|nr:MULTISPECIES: hypothetical protein [unclassified Streptomyces]MDJ0340042.1 hypothetical protein [Streptomyces sp. PH10-H1]MDJ0369321.1 hypothetical protein [Streptomyces sp. H10-C2]